MRKTIVVKGIKENAHESWDDTRELVARTISDNIKTVSFDDAYDMLDRVHRSPPTKNPSKIGKRDIYAALNYWDDSQFLINNFRKLNRRKDNFNIYIDYKYGPLTTRRRNQALKRRRELLESGVIVQGYVSYPAKLFVKHDKNDDNYVLLENFSNEDVVDVSLTF